MVTGAPPTAEKLAALRLDKAGAELVDGVLVVREPAGFLHGKVAARLAYALGPFVEEHELGVVLAAETGFTLRRRLDTVRAADVAFVSAGAGTVRGNRVRRRAPVHCERFDHGARA